MAACLGVFVYELLLPEKGLVRLFYLYGIVPARPAFPETTYAGVPVGNLLPLGTNIFLHAGWMHLVSNLWALWIFGDNVEDRMGRARFLAFYLLCGIAAGLTHWLPNPGSAIPAVGASGAIAGVMGAYLALFPRSTVITLIPVFFYATVVELPAVLYLGIWGLSQVWNGTWALASAQDAAGVAWWAHVGGFAAGLLLHPLFLRPASARARR